MRRGLELTRFIKVCLGGLIMLFAIPIIPTGIPRIDSRLVPMVAAEQATPRPTSTSSVHPRCRSSHQRTSCSRLEEMRDILRPNDIPTPTSHPSAEENQQELEHQRNLNEIRKQIGPMINSYDGPGR